MNKIHVLDCTLRDGGYVNDWLFGHSNIQKMVQNLTLAGIDIIECGFLTQKGGHYNQDSSLFDEVRRVRDFLPENHLKSSYVCMINYGEYEIEAIPENDGTSIDGIRVAFHKKDRFDALAFCAEIARKGYQAYIQPMVAVTYSDEEYIDLIKRANTIKPFAFYIVDSFGVMKKNDLMRLYYLVDHNLDREIHIGYHAHNNIQLAYSNAQSLIELKTNRELIIDSSVFGMGRGAGNLNTELLIEFLNELYNTDYQVKPLLQIIDQTLVHVYQTKTWGYSLPYYISAKHNCHPNYATYLDEKKSLTVEEIGEIMNLIDPEKRNNFDRGHIEDLYRQFQSKAVAKSSDQNELAEKFRGKKLLLIAPGRSIMDEMDKVIAAAGAPDTISVAINFSPEQIPHDFIFVSNLRRYEELTDVDPHQLITTSNINSFDRGGFVLAYASLLNTIDPVQDNSILLFLKFLSTAGVSQVAIAGLDGYSADMDQNYISKAMTFTFDKQLIEKKNTGIEKMLGEFVKSMNIASITTPRQIKFPG